MSNHYHIICTDPEGRLPVFSRELNRLLAKSLNSVLGRWENFWAGGTEPSYVRLEDADAVLAATVYAMANPVEAGLVSHGNQWPGLRVCQGGRNVAWRPNFYFLENGKAEKKVEFTMTVAPVGGAPGEALKRIQAAVTEAEKRIRAEFKRDRRAFTGARAVKAQSYFDSPQSLEPRRGLSPRLATKDKELRRDSIARMKAFVCAYREALKSWCAGVRDVVFPFGTYHMAVHHHVYCDEA